MKKLTLKSFAPSVKDKHTRNEVFLYVLVVILTLMFVLVTVTLKVTRDELRTESTLRQYDSNATLLKMIREASDNLYQPALIEPKEQKQYVYEMHVRFPLTNEEDRILAGLGSSSGDSIEYAMVTSRSLKPTAGSILDNTNSESLMNSVPMFQKCTRPFLIQFSQNPLEYSDEYDQVGMKKLANGKTLYVFKSNACTHKYFTDKHTQVEMNRLQAQLLQAESY